MAGFGSGSGDGVLRPNIPVPKLITLSNTEEAITLGRGSALGGDVAGAAFACAALLLRRVSGGTGVLILSSALLSVLPAVSSAVLDRFDACSVGVQVSYGAVTHYTALQSAARFTPNHANSNSLPSLTITLTYVVRNSTAKIGKIRLKCRQTGYES